MSLIITGDIMLGRNVKNLFSERDFKKKFEPLKDIINSNPLIGNLESPLTTHKSILIKSNSSPKFSADPNLASILKEVNFIGFSIANNHIFDSGKQGLIQTIRTLNKANISTFGAGLNFNQAFKPFNFIVDSTKISCIGCSYGVLATASTPGVANAYDKVIFDLIKIEKKKSDIVIVFPHTGIELLDWPLPRDKKLFRNMIKSGADLVVGSHPHCIQASEQYLNKWIFYSIGDLVFDHSNKQVWKKFRSKNSNAMRYVPEASKNKTLFSLMLEIKFKDKAICDIKKNLLQIPKETKMPVGQPTTEKQYKNWYKNYEEINYRFQNDKSLHIRLQEVEKDLLKRLSKGV